MVIAPKRSTSIFIKSSPSFQGKVVQKTAEVVAKNKRGFFTAIASLLGLSPVATAKVSKTAVEKPVEEPKSFGNKEIKDKR